MFRTIILTLMLCLATGCCCCRKQVSYDEPTPPGPPLPSAPANTGQ
jgi:hypothetical protein